MKREDYKRANFMTDDQKAKMGKAVRRHDVCKELTGVQRPGKTAQDRARRTHAKD